MTNEEKLNKIQQVLKGNGIVEAVKIDKLSNDPEFTPHPYCITERHIAGNYTTIGDEQIKQLEHAAGKGMCGMYVNSNGDYTNQRKAGFKKCTLRYEEHVKNTNRQMLDVCFLQLLTNTTRDEMTKIMQTLVNNIGETFIDGFAFLETPEKYRVL